MILASADEMTIDKLAEIANRIIDVATPIVTAVSTPTEDNRIRKLIREELNTALQVQHRSRP